MATGACSSINPPLATTGPTRVAQLFMSWNPSWFSTATCVSFVSREFLQLTQEVAGCSGKSPRCSDYHINCRSQSDNGAFRALGRPTYYVGGQFLILSSKISCR